MDPNQTDQNDTNETPENSSPTQETMTTPTNSSTNDLQTKQPANPNERIYRILVVDDEEPAKEMFVEILTELSDEPNWEVSSAVDGVEALAKMEATHFDLVLLDIMMPKKDGIQTLQEIKASPDKYGTPRVMMLTNIGGDLAIEEALKLGAVGYRLKNDTEAEALIQVVRDELNKV